MFPNRAIPLPHTSGHAQDAWPRPPSLAAFEWAVRVHEGPRNATYCPTIGMNLEPSATFLWQNRGVYPMSYHTPAYYGQMPLSLQPIFVPRKPWERLR